MRTQIVGSGFVTGEHLVTNDQLSRVMDTSEDGSLHVDADRARRYRAHTREGALRGDRGVHGPVCRGPGAHLRRSR